MADLAELLREAEERRRAAHVAPPAVRQKPWYRIETKAAAPKQAELWIFDVIGSSWFDEGTDAKSFTKDLAGLDVEEILLHVNSPGGDAFDGLAIYNALVDHKARVTAVVEGVAASAASFIVQAGDVRRVNRAGQMMIHDAAGFAMGNPREMQQALDMLEKISASIAGIYASRGGGSAEDWRTAMRAETWYTAAEAVDAGLADEAVDDAAPPAARASFDLAVFNYAGRQAAPPPAMPSMTARTQTPEPAGPGTTTEGGAVADNAKLREALGLKADASDQEVTAALVTAGFTADPPQPNPPTPQTPPPSDPPQPPAEPQPQPRAKAGSDGDAVLIDPAQLKELQRLATRGDEAFRQLREKECDQVLDAAIKAGKFPPARREHWKELWAVDPDGTKQTIDKLRANTIPVSSAGYTGVGDETEQDMLYRQVYPERFAGQGT